MKFKYALDLQMFADGLIDFEEDGEDVGALDEFGDEIDESAGGTEDDLDLDESDYEDEGEGEETDFMSLDEGDDDDDKEDKPPVVEEKPEDTKPAQTEADNARFAEQRRQRQAEEAFKQSPEYQLAQTLAQANGLSVEQMLQKVKDAAIEAEAKTRSLPVEVVRAERAQLEATTKLQEELNQVKFQMWQSRIDGEKAAVKQAMPFLSDTELDNAVEHMLTLKQPDMPLEQAVYQLHGKTITAKIREAAKNEALAEMSGRKKSAPLAPKGNRAAANDSGLTAEERMVAKEIFGISEKEFAKYK